MLVYRTNTQSRKGWIKPKLVTRNSVQVFHVASRDIAHFNHLLLSPRDVLARRWSQEQSLNRFRTLVFIVLFVASIDSVYTDKILCEYNLCSI